MKDNKRLNLRQIAVVLLDIISVEAYWMNICGHSLKLKQL